MKNEVHDNDCNKAKIKVLYILDSLKQRFGVTAVAMNYFRNIDTNRVQIDFLVLEDSEKAIVDEITQAGSNVYFMPRLSLKNIKEFIDFYNTFFKIHNDYKIVHSHFNQIDSIVFPIAKKHGVKHCISHSHNTKYSDYRIRAIRNWAMCIPLKYLADTWAACGIKAGEFLYGKNFMKSKKHLVINNAIDTEKFKYCVGTRKKIRQEYGITNEFIIGNVGSLKIQKNQQYLINVFSDLKKKHLSDWHYKLMIVGDGDLKDELHKLAIDLGVADDTIFTGSKSNVNELLQAMDVFVLPSLYEGLPVIGIEAQASGIPCLFSDTITTEVNICNTRFFKLNENKKEWILGIEEAEKFVREDSSELIRTKGFCINDEAEMLTNYYEDICHKSE